MLDYIQSPMDFTSPVGRSIMTVFFPFFLSIHRGYNLNSMIVEAGAMYEQTALTAGFRLYKTLDLDRESSSRASAHRNHAQAGSLCFSARDGRRYTAFHPGLGRLHLSAPHVSGSPPASNGCSCAPLTD